MEIPPWNLNASGGHGDVLHGAAGSAGLSSSSGAFGSGASGSNPAGKKVEVRLQSGKKLEGPLVSAAESSFTVQVDKNPMSVSYQDVQSVKRKGMSGLKKGLIIGGIVAVAGAVGGILAAISRG